MPTLTNNEVPAGTVDSRAAAGPYDFAIFIARSLGRSLPAVVVLGLIAFGAVYGLREMARLNTQLNQAQLQEAEAKIKKTEAEAAANKAGTEARLTAMQEYSEQLQKLNAVSADVSKRLQDLVSGQLTNMAKANQMNEDQDAKSRKLQQEISKQKEDDLAKLQSQIEEARRSQEETQTKYAESVRVAGLASYNDLKANIATQMSKGYLEATLLDLLNQKLSDPKVQAQAIIDAKDEEQNIDMRLVLYIQLFKNTLQGRYLLNWRSLADGHKRLVSPVIANSFGYRSSIPDQQLSELVPVLGDFVIDEAYVQGFRDNLLPFLGSMSSSQMQILDPEIAKKVAKYAGRRLIELTQMSEGNSYKLYGIYEVIESISPEAALVYATEAVQHAAGPDDQEKRRKVDQLEKSINGRRPTQDAKERWLGSATTPS